MSRPTRPALRPPYSIIRRVPPAALAAAFAIATLAACGTGSGERRRVIPDDDASVVDAIGGDAGLDTNLPDLGGDTDREDTSRRDTGGEDTVEPPECVENADCAGGQVCDDGECREICFEDGDCPGGHICTEEGTCKEIECRDNEDCGARELCVDFGCEPLPPGDVRLSPEELLLEAPGPTEAGRGSIRIENIGRGPLRILEVIHPVDTAFVIAADIPGTLEPGASATLGVRYEPPDLRRHTDTLTIRTDDPDTPEASVALTGEVATGEISLSTSTLDFGSLSSTSRTCSVEVRNLGAGTLTLTDVSVTGSPFLLLDDPAGTRLEPGAATSIAVRAERTATEDRSGVLVIRSDDPERSRVEVRLIANRSTPCIEITPSDALDFGRVGIGTERTESVRLRSCSTFGDTTIRTVRVSGDPEFVVSDAPSLPLVLGPGDETTVGLSFFAESEGEYEGVLSIAHDDPTTDDAEIALSAEAVEGGCPIAVAGVRRAGSTSAFTSTLSLETGGTVELSSEGSFDPDGTELSYRWQLRSGPDDSDSREIGTRRTANFTVASCGRWVFELDVTDGDGEHACEPAVVVVTVGIDDPVTFVLTWETPSDPDPDDEGVGAGADVDIRLRRGTTASWDSDTETISFRNRAASWGAELLRDDTDGRGPEEIQLCNREPRTYSVGIHYWNDNGFGTSTARVTIETGERVIDAGTYELRRTNNFWYAGDFRMPSMEWTERRVFSEGIEDADP